MFFTSNHVECIASGATIEYTINVLRVHSFFFFLSCFPRFSRLHKKHRRYVHVILFFRLINAFSIDRSAPFIFLSTAVHFFPLGSLSFATGHKVDQSEPRPNGFPVEYRATVNILSELSQRALYVAGIYDRILRGVCIWIFAFSLAAGLMPVFLCLWAQSHPGEPLPVIQIKRSD